MRTRKTLCLVLAAVLLCAVLLSGCGKSENVKNAEACISAIGTVTSESGDLIKEARDAYRQLTDKEKDHVENYALLTEAERAYEQCLAADVDALISAIGEVTPDREAAIKKAREQYNALSVDAKKHIELEKTLVSAEAEFVTLAIDSIGTVTADSGTVIQRARNQYNELSATAKKQVGNYDVLTAAEDALLKAEEAAVTAALNSGNYQGAIDAFQELAKNRGIDNLPDDTIQACVAAFQGKSKELEAAGSKLAAVNILQTGKTVVNTPQAAEQLESSLTALKDRIQQSEPANGTVLHSGCQGGYGEVTIKNDNSPALVKLESTSDPSVYLTVYVRAGSSTTVHVNDGSYRLKYAVGTVWYGEQDLFGGTTSCSEANSVISISTTYSGNQVSYSSVQLTLYQVPGGNMSTKSIPTSGF